MTLGEIPVGLHRLERLERLERKGVPLLDRRFICPVGGHPRERSRALNAVSFLICEAPTGGDVTGRVKEHPLPVRHRPGSLPNGRRRGPRGDQSELGCSRAARRSPAVLERVGQEQLLTMGVGGDGVRRFAAAGIAAVGGGLPPAQPADPLPQRETAPAGTALTDLTVVGSPGVAAIAHPASGAGYATGQAVDAGVHLPGEVLLVAPCAQPGRVVVTDRAALSARRWGARAAGARSRSSSTGGPRR
jgi:hypothetical protein